MILLAAVHELVRAECARATNRFGPSFFDDHVLPVVARARELAPRLGARRDVVELAAYLHDLAAIRDLSCVPTHAADGARLAGELLRARGAPAPLAEAVARCAAAHSSPVAPGRGSAEEVCLSNADLLAQLARPAYWFFYLHGVRGLGQGEALAWWRGRFAAASALAPEALALAGPDHAALVRLVEGAGAEPAATGRGEAR
jgi:predicted metal-dependent HD superfamily phosphohydrolase